MDTSPSTQRLESPAHDGQVQIFRAHDFSHHVPHAIGRFMAKLNRGMLSAHASPHASGFNPKKT
jgi:hypothetical protein